MTRYRIRTRPTQPFAGERNQARPGRGLEFYELRGYVPGDEPRFVDWKAYARAGRLYTRTFQAEAPARFTFFLDGSPSMGLYGKAEYAERVLHVLARAAKAEGATLWGAGPYRGKSRAVAAGPAELLRVPRPRGATVLITDGLDELDWGRLLKRLKRVVLVQVMAPEELSPSLTEAWLHDVETNERMEVGRLEVERYLEALEQHLRCLKTIARRLGSYALLRVGEAILPALLKQGVLEER
ncbi:MULTISPECIES: DUF58 domain-containing protein [unclassified Meiothermus]|uniref:DUF58 domain-containing protein n=1 Tax=unclassified Meiothermus TaxID=370471 RepID=UPI000D7CA8D8|nr:MULTISPECIES: DUF58 domain-containing protein [unclassified Meiothermus]PZA08045.1 DUF58 domain-containing protein [Meiothermus sp. Pnk-1]RYM32708.1 DUF58 domain-containing protein [Meiothermus sp. PNK-Is4]